MSHPLKNVSVQEIELAIAQALQALVPSSGKVFSVRIQELHFDAMDTGLNMTLQTKANTPPNKQMGF